MPEPIQTSGPANRFAGRVSIVMPVLNQVGYTRGCVESLAPDLSAGAELIIIDNGSTDPTPAYLATLSTARAIRNDVNRGCAAAWNQGVNASTREWIVILNNDVLVGEGWLDGLGAFAENTGCGIVTPAIREGQLDYDFKPCAAEFVARMKNVSRLGAANGICFMVRRSVFERIGLFDENFRIGQYEDADFFLRARKAGIQLGTTGAAFLHHFGSITQKAVQKAAGTPDYAAENRAYFRKKWGVTRWRRFWQRFYEQTRVYLWSAREQRRFGSVLHEARFNPKT